MNRLTITIPHLDNEGVPLALVHRKAEEYFLEHFGGFSVDQIFGHWQDPEDLKIYREASARYEILTDEHIDSLYPIAKIVKTEGKQKCVLLTEETVVMECQ